MLRAGACHLARSPRLPPRTLTSPDLHPARCSAQAAPAVQRRWLALSDAFAPAGSPRTPSGVFRSNGFAKEGHLGGDLYELLSRANHSCLPNAEREVKEGGEVVLRALRGVQRGEELTICCARRRALEPRRACARRRRASHNLLSARPRPCTDRPEDSAMPTAVRRERLQQTYNFVCVCHRCKNT